MVLCDARYDGWWWRTAERGEDSGQDRRQPRLHSPPHRLFALHLSDALLCTVQPRQLLASSSPSTSAAAELGCSPTAHLRPFRVPQSPPSLSTPPPPCHSRSDAPASAIDPIASPSHPFVPH